MTDTRHFITSAPGGTSRMGGLRLSDEGSKRRYDSKQISGNEEIREFGDRYACVAIYRHYRSRRLHSTLVLNGPGDSDGDVELWANDLARLTNLEAVRNPPSVCGRPRGADCSAESLGKRAQQRFEWLGATKSPAAAHDDGSFL